VTKRIIHILIVSTALITMVGCKTTKEVVTESAVGVKSHNEFFESLQRNAFQYETLSIRFSADITMQDRSFSSRVDMKMVKDSVFQLSVVPFLGIEVFRIEFTTDSIKAVDRINRRYVAEDYSSMNGKLPIDFNYYNLQALFTNHLFLPGEKGISEKQYSQFKLDQSGTTAKAIAKDAMNLLYTFTADREDKLLSAQIADDAKQHGMQWDYRDFRIVGNQPFPMLMNVQVVADKSVVGRLVLSSSRVEPNIPLSLTFSIPARYERITFAQILNGLNNSKE